MSKIRAKSTVVLVVVTLALGLIGGYFVGSTSGVTVVTTSTTTTTTTLTTNITTLITYITSTTGSGSRYLTAAQGVAEGAMFMSVSCLTKCNSTSGNASYFPVPGMTHFYAQVDVNASVPGVSAGVSSHDGNEIELTVSNSNTNWACFEYLLIDTQLPPTIYVWYVGQSEC